MEQLDVLYEVMLKSAREDVREEVEQLNKTEKRARKDMEREKRDTKRLRRELEDERIQTKEALHKLKDERIRMEKALCELEDERIQTKKAIRERDDYVDLGRHASGMRHTITLLLPLFVAMANKLGITAGQAESKGHKLVLMLKDADGNPLNCTFPGVMPSKRLDRIPRVECLAYIPSDYVRHKNFEQIMEKRKIRFQRVDALISHINKMPLSFICPKRPLEDREIETL